MRPSFNKGEWSEIYVACFLVYQGELEVHNDGSYLIDGISSVDGDYSIRRNDGDSVAIDFGLERFGMERSEFGHAARAIRDRILSEGDGRGSFSIPEIDGFLESSGILRIRPGSGSRSDISVLARDRYTGSAEDLTFSIKSLVGGRPTILNVSEGSGIDFMIVGDMNTEIQETVNSLDGVKERIAYLKDNGFLLKYAEYRNETFHYNLSKVDSRFPEIFAYSVAVYYSIRGSSMSRIINGMETEGDPATNACFRRDFSDFPVRFKFGELLMHAASGMTTTREWEGNYDVSGGYIIVGQSGNITCFAQNGVREMKEYLLENSCMDTPATRRHNFGMVYESDDGFFITLMAQVRICT